MNLNPTLVSVAGTLLLAGAFTHAMITAQPSTVGFQVLTEDSHSITPPKETGQNLPATATWEGKDHIVVTTAGYQDCPVVPATVTQTEGVITIGLVTVPGASDCGAALETLTTTIRLEDWSEDQATHLEVRMDGE